MRYLKEMLELAKSKGIYDQGYASSRIDKLGEFNKEVAQSEVQSINAEIYSAQYQNSLFDKLRTLVEKCHPFVFHGWPAPDKVQVVQSGEEIPLPESLGLPFQTCSFEAHEGPLHTVVYSPEDETMTENRYCMLTNEIEPKIYEFFFLERQDVGHGELMGVVYGRSDQYFPGMKPIQIIEKCIQGLSKNQEMAVEIPKYSIKVGRKHDVRYVKISNIIHINFKKGSTDSLPLLNGEPMEWTHRWHVRGHWRTFEGEGKNRDGVRCVKGYTWVSEHVKGPEEAPLIMKERHISNKESQQ